MTPGPFHLRHRLQLRTRQHLDQLDLAFTLMIPTTDPSRAHQQCLLHLPAIRHLVRHHNQKRMRLIVRQIRFTPRDHPVWRPQQLRRLPLQCRASRSSNSSFCLQGPVGGSGSRRSLSTLQLWSVFLVSPSGCSGRGRAISWRSRFSKP